MFLLVHSDILTLVHLIIPMPRNSEAAKFIVNRRSAVIAPPMSTLGKYPGPWHGFQFEQFHEDL